MVDERASAGGRSSRPKPVPHFTPAERAARGKAARSELPRSAHAGWEPAPVRGDPVELLEEQAQTRLPELVPIRYGRMLDSPFAFFRGGAYLMAADLAAGPRTGLHAQLCGDAHLSNFGIFAAPDRQARLLHQRLRRDAARPVRVGRQAPRRELRGRRPGSEASTTRRGARSVTATVREYREAMANFATMRNIDVWYARLDVAGIREQLGRRVAEADEAAAARTSRACARKTACVRSRSCAPRSTVSSDSSATRRSSPPSRTFCRAPRGSTSRTSQQMIGTYRRSLPHDRRHLLESYRYVHAARKVVGVGSVGARRWILLLLGRDDSDPLFLQFKEAQASVLEPFLGRSELHQHGQRVVEGQRMMQAASDILLGWERVVTIDGEKRDFYIRQLWDSKASAEIELMDAAGLAAYGRVCGWTLARAHARSGDRIAIAAYLGAGDSFDRAMASFAETYADQNERDYGALQDAVASGRVAAQLGLDEPASARHDRRVGLEGEVDGRREVVLAEDVRDPVAMQRAAHAALRARDDQPDPERVEGVVHRPQRLRARHVHVADRLEVEDDRAGPRLRRVNSREHVVLEEIGVGEDQLRLEAMDQHAGNRRRVRVVLEVDEARAVAAAPERRRCADGRSCGSAG